MANAVNWGGTLPSGNADNAIFTNAAGATTTLTLGSSMTLRTLQFSNSAFGATGYTIGNNNGNSITIGATNSAAIFINSFFSGTGLTTTIAAPVVMSTNIAIYNATMPSTGNVLKFTGTVSDGGSNLLLTIGNSGARGLVEIAGNLNVDGLVIGGGAVLTLSGENTIRASTVNIAVAGTMKGVGVQGTLNLDYTTNNGNKISGNLYMDGSKGQGKLNIIGNGSAATNLGLDLLSIGGNSSSAINVTTTGQNTTLTVASVKRGSGATLDITMNAIAGGAASVIFQSFQDTGYAMSNGILGWVTINKTYYAAVDGTGVVSALTMYDNNLWAAGKNTNITESNLSAFTGNTNSLRFNEAEDITLTLSNLASLTNGGILVTPNVGDHDITITGGTIEKITASGFGKEVVIFQNNTQGDLIIESSIGANYGPSALVKAGAGRVILRGNNIYNGQTILEDGVIMADSTTAFGIEGLINIGGMPGAYIDLNGYSYTFKQLTSSINLSGTAQAKAGLIPYLANYKAGSVSTVTIYYNVTTPAYSTVTGAPMGLVEGDGAILSFVKTGNAGLALFGDGSSLQGYEYQNYNLINGDLDIREGWARVQNAHFFTTGVLNIESGASLTARTDQAPGVVSVGYLSGTGTINLGHASSGNVLVVNHNGSAKDVFGGTIIGNTILVQNGAGTLEVGNIASDGTFSSLWVNATGTLVTPGLSSPATDKSVHVVGKSTLKITGTSGTVIGHGTANASGNNSLQIAGGTLWIAPSGSAADVSVSGLDVTNASNQGASFTFQGGAKLILDKGSNNSLTFTIGNAANTTYNTISRINNGSLEIIASHGLGALGSTEKFIVQGGLGQTTVNGILPAFIVARDGLTGNASFVKYDVSNGFMEAGYTDTNFGATTTNATIEKIDSSTSVITAKSVYAMRVDAALSNTSTITIGSGSSSYAGLILNGVTISGTGTLDASNREFTIYVKGINEVENTLTTSSGLTLFGQGTLVLKQTAQLNGATRINDGVLDISLAALSGGNLSLYGGVLQTSGTFTRTLGTGNAQVAWSPSNTGNLMPGGGFAARGGDLTVAIGGVATPTALVWGGTNGSQSSTNFLTEGGVLMFGSTTADSKVIFTNSINLGVVNGDANAPETTGNASRVILVTDNPNSAADYASITGVISSTHPFHNLVKDGDGELELAGINTYTGSTTIHQGTLRISRDENLGAAPTAAYAIKDWATATPGALVIGAGATLRATDSFTLNSNRTMLLASGTTGATASKINVDVNKTMIFNGKIGDYIGEIGSLEKTGVGSLVLGGISEFTGQTIVSAGRLIVNGDIRTSSLTWVKNGGTLGGSGHVSAIQLDAGGAINPGDGTIATLNGDSATWNAGGILRFDLSGTDNTSDLLALSGVLSKGGSGIYGFDFSNTGAAGMTYTLVSFASTDFNMSDFSYSGLADGLSGTFNLASDHLEFSVTAIPEPTTWMLLILGGVSLVAVRGLRRFLHSA